jgi:hypothetical protein
MGKSSLFNMLCPEAKAHTSNDGKGCTETEAKHACDLDDGQGCMVHDTVGIPEGGSWMSIRSFFGIAPTEATRLEKYLKKMQKSGGLHLLVYCMSKDRCKKSSQTKTYRKLKGVVGANVPIVVVVTGFELFRDRERWWRENARTLGMDSPGYHACVTALPLEKLSNSEKAFYHESRKAVKELIRGLLQVR